MEQKCSPSKINEKYSCFSIDNLKKMGNVINKVYGTNINISCSDKVTLLEELSVYFPECKKGDYICWLKNPIIKNIDDSDIQYNTFRPYGPSKVEWLATNNINNVMDQYEYKYKDFKFLGCVSYDFEKYFPITNPQRIKHYYEKGFYKYGMVINLDKMSQSGSHWVSLYFDISQRTIYFFDSVGKKPKPLIENYIYKIKDLISDITKQNCEYRYNNIQHQFDDGECGVYAMNFIIKKLSGESFNNIINHVIRDNEMKKCRDFYFNYL